jgi:hypothetical protein
MRLQMLFAILFLPLACWDETPVQPESSAPAEIAPVRAQTFTGDADKMVPFRADGVRWGTPGDAFYGDQGWYGTELWEGEISSVGSSR